jgi:hypothetical protein
MADGTDVAFAEVVLEFKRGNPAIRLEAYIPYRRRLANGNDAFQRVIQECDAVIAL